MLAQELQYTIGGSVEAGVSFKNGRVYAGRNPAQPSDLVEFLREARIQQAIEVTKEQEAAFQSLYSKLIDEEQCWQATKSMLRNPGV